MIIKFIFLILSNLAWSQTPFYGATSAAMGGSGRASVFPSETSLNPAMITQVKGYNMSFDYRDFYLDPSGHAIDLRASVVDNNPDNITPASFTYGQTKTDQEFRLAFARRILDRLAFGIEAQRYIYEPVSGQQKIENDVTLGFLYGISPSWAVGVVGANLIRTNLVKTDQTFAVASTYSLARLFRIQVDLLYRQQNNPMEKLIFLSGIESGIIPDCAIRMGYRADNPTKTYFWTAGFGWNGPKLDLNYGFEANIKSNKEKAHSVDVRIYF